MPTGNEGENLQQNQSTADSSATTQNQQTLSGEIDYSKIDWTKVDWTKVPADAVPESVVKQTKTGKALLEETIQRRQTISQMKEALGEKPAEEPKKTTSTQVQDDVPAWAKALLQDVSEIKADKAKSTINEMIEAAMAANKLPSEARSALVGTTKEAIDAQAVAIAKLLVPQDGTLPGNPAGKTEGDVQSRARSIIQAHLKGSTPVADSNQSIFGSDRQRIK